MTNGMIKKYNYILTKSEIKNTKIMLDTGSYYTNRDFAIDKNYVNIKGQAPIKDEELETRLKNILTEYLTERYTFIKNFEIGELKISYRKSIKVAKYSYYDENYGYMRNIYINKKYNSLFKNFDLKFGREFDPVLAYKGKNIIGVVMPIFAKDSSYCKTVNNEIEE